MQAFLDEWAKVDAGNGVEREEMLRRKRLRKRGEKSLVLLYSMSVKSVEQRVQEKERPRGALAEALDQLQLNDHDLPPALPPREASVSNIVNGVRISVVGVRVVKEKRHVREHEHDVRSRDYTYLGLYLFVPYSSFARIFSLFLMFFFCLGVNRSFLSRALCRMAENSLSLVVMVDSDASIPQ